jgi:hypothetical protein
MKKIYFLFVTSLITFNTYAQTTLKYSGNATTTYFGFNYKIAGIGDMDVSNNADQIGTHIGLFGQATNARGINIGVYGTTKQNTLTSNVYYTAIYGNNLSNQLSIPSGYVTGGSFFARNYGDYAITKGIEVAASGTNNSSNVIGMDATAYNTANTTSNRTIAVRGITTSGNSTTLFYQDTTNPGGYFSSNDGQGVYGTTTDGYNYATVGKISQGVTGYSNIENAYINAGVLGAVAGSGKNKYGLWGYLLGPAGTDLSAAVFATDVVGANNTHAGYFQGKVTINGNLTINGNSSASGVKTFRIDHPLDPKNKILRHAAMESNEVLNQYSGNITTDTSGYATVTLPNYFETLNKDFRYQLTVIGSFSQAIIKQEVINNQFTIQTNQPSIKVSWQVTGVRNDKVMQYTPFAAETEKTDTEKGNYLSPEAYGKPSNTNTLPSIPSLSLPKDKK